MSRIRDQIKYHEGVEHKIYLDTEGLPTVGVGHLILKTDPEYELEVGTYIDEERVNELFEQDLEVCISELDKNIKWWKDLDEVRQRCLIDLTFNLGMPRLKKFKKTLDHLQHKRYEEASVELLDSRYARQVGKRANRISEMIRTGGDTKDF